MSACRAPPGFIGEFLTLLGTFQVNNWVATFATLGIILSAAYALWLYRKVIFGKLEKPSLARHQGPRLARDHRSWCRWWSLTIFFGIYPKPMLDMSAASVTQLIDNFNHACRRQRARGATLAR